MAAETDPEEDQPVVPQLLLLAGLADVSAARLEAALAGGPVACAILSPRASDPADKTVLDEGSYLDALREAVSIVQAAGAAALVVDDTQAAGRTDADGLHLTVAGSRARFVREAVARGGGGIVGVSGLRERDLAMDAGEAGPDYLFIGPLHGDTHPQPHKRTIELAAWWSQVATVPAVVPAGSDIESVATARDTGAAFVATSSAVFGSKGAERDRVARAVELLGAGR